MSKEIMVCNEHETPLIWTFVFAYAEYFCMQGNHAGGVFGTGHEVQATPELLKLKALYNRRWGQLKKHIVAGRFQRRGCDRCEGSDQYHNDHLTDDEKRRSSMALAKLKEYSNA